MTWKNITSIQTTKNWLYSEPFIGDSIRIRHSLTNESTPWGFYGLIAQVFGYPNAIELFDIRKIYPKTNYHNIYLIPNPFPNRQRRIAIRGQQKYKTPITWITTIDYWSEPITLFDNDSSGIEAIEKNLTAQIKTINRTIDEVTSLPEVSDLNLEQENTSIAELPMGYYF
ncbi:MAG: hypothetical protein AB4368_14035 [Xenococcaceae cyanobacterium]